MGLGRAAPCQDIAASSHRLSCEYDGGDQRGRRQEGQSFGSPMVTEVEEALDPSL
jgi:hypothetical protein